MYVCCIDGNSVLVYNYIMCYCVVVLMANVYNDVY